VSQTSSIVSKSSQWNLPHLIPMKSQCLSNTFCEPGHGGSKVMSLFLDSYMCLQRECHNLLPLDSSIFSLTSKPIFKTVICNVQQAFELFKNGSWDFLNSLTQWAFLCLRPHGPTHNVQVFKFHPCSFLFRNNENT